MEDKLSVQLLFSADCLLGGEKEEAGEGLRRSSFCQENCSYFPCYEKYSKGRKGETAHPRCSFSSSRPPPLDVPRTAAPLYSYKNGYEWGKL